VTVYRASTRTRLGHKLSLGGALSNRDGNPIPGAQIHVYSTPQGGAEQLAAVIQTDAQGRYSYTLRADINRTLRLAYQGTALMLPVERQVMIRVAAATSFRVSKRRVPNGGRVLFSGRVRSLPVPATGKIVELQWRVGGADWGTFRTVRTDAQGRWRLPYQFSRIRSTVRLAFRARVPAEGGYPFVTGGSRVKRITVTGRS
jgi:5-hydroxyisourate hydrolase-like protein (transthyretin family)